MRFSDAEGRKIVSTSSAETVGKVDEFVIDPSRRSIVALEVKKADGGDTLAWSDITGFGDDAVTVSGAEKITVRAPEIDALAGKAHRVLGKRVLSTLGDELGKVKDVEFEPSSGTVTAIVLDGGQVEGVRLVGIGSYAVVVQAVPVAGPA